MRALKVGVYSESSRNKRMMGKPMSEVRNRFTGDTDISSLKAGQRGPMKNKVGKYSGDVHKRIVKHVR